MKKIFTILIFISIASFAGDTSTAGAIDSIKVLFSSQQPADTIWNKYNSNKEYNNMDYKDSEFSQLEEVLKNRAESSRIIDDYHLLTRVQCHVYTREKKIGKALMSADDFLQRVKKSGDSRKLINAYFFFSNIYSQMGMYKEELAYVKLVYVLMQKYGSEHEKKIISNSSLSWAFYQLGRETNDATALDSSAFYRKKIIEYREHHYKTEGEALEAYKTYIMAIIRLKRYEEVIAVARKAFNISEKEKIIKKDATDGTKSYLNNISKKMLNYLAVSYASLGKKDSAYNCINNKLLFTGTKNDRSTFIKTLNKNFDFEDLYQRIKVLSILSEHKSAAQLLDDAVFSASGFKDSAMLYDLYEAGAPVYEKAGRYKEAAYCYSKTKNHNEILYHEDKRLHIESEKINAQLQFDAAKKQALAEQEQKDLRQRNIRILFSAGFALVFIILILVYMQHLKLKREKKKLEDTLAELQSTQKQLVESEKMAAFGVMASRVSHEIQNPLNFVTNFSKVSADMLDEILETPDEVSFKESVSALRDNLSKILHHGNRADEIVKQLQRRSNAGTAHQFFEE